MRLCLIVYHKNAEFIYDAKWIQKFKETILNQTYDQFDIFEVEYGGGNYRIFESSIYESKEFPTFVHCMNYMLDEAFNMGGYDYVMNGNIDDYFSEQRIEKQLMYMAKGFDLISSNFSLIRDDVPIHTHRFDKLDIKSELDNNNNVVCHPSVCYSKRFWGENRYIPEEIPVEDMLLWKRAINNGMKFVILPDVLCYHRLHEQSVCQSNNR